MTRQQTSRPPWRAPQPGLAVLETAGAAYRALWTRRDDMLRLVVVPVLVVFAFHLLLAWQFGIATPSQAGEPTAFDPWLYPALLLAWVPVAQFSVNWLRVLLLGSAAVHGIGLHWGRRETRFLLYMILIFVASAAAFLAFAIPLGVILAMVGGILGGAGGGPLGSPMAPAWGTMIGITVAVPVVAIQIFVMFRLALALPATALDQARALHRAWTMARGSVLRLIAAYLLVIVPVYLVVAALQMLLYLLAAVAPYASQLIVAALGMIGIAAGSSVLAVAYQRLGGPLPPGDASR